MYSRFLFMIQPVYQNYFNENGQFRYKSEFERKDKCVLRQEVYDYLTSEPHQQGNRYFDQVPQNLMQLVQKISGKQYDKWVPQDYFLISTGDLPAKKDTYLTVRVVANFASQITAINIAADLLNRYRNGQFPTIYKYKILLGNTSNKKPVKLDKIVIYNKIALSMIKDRPISVLIAQQIQYLRQHCLLGAALPQFVACPLNSVPVGFGEGISYQGPYMSFREVMAFSDPRADSVLEVLMKSKAETTNLNSFQQSLSEEFKKRGLSQNIPYINQCSKELENRWG